MIENNKLSIVIPVYNEVNYILEILDRVQSAEIKNVDKEIIVVDDNSNDGTKNLLQQINNASSSSVEINNPQTNTTHKINTNNITILFHDKNQGKGSCLQDGFNQLNGDIVVIQDADLEYDPGEYSELIEPIRNTNADVVFGSRFLGGPQRVLFFWHYVGNKFLTLLSNMFTNLNLSDMETCYKMFKRSVIEHIDIEQEQFGFEPEFTAKVAKRDYKIYEVPISYYGRTYEEGKKINWKDGIIAVWCIFRYNLFP